METSHEVVAERTATSKRAAAVFPLSLAGVASIGAGAVHAAAIGVHNDHPEVVSVFIALGAAQIIWGAVALVSRSRLVSGLGAVLGLAAVAGFLLAKTTGISFIEGMETSESVQWADGLCAALALIAFVISVAHLTSIAGKAAADRRASSPARRSAGIGIVAVVALLTVSGMKSSTSHNHAGADHHGPGSETADNDHAHDGTDGGTGSGTGDHGGTDSGSDGETDHSGHGVASTVAPVPYDPDLPIDLGGVDGVTLQQQARAENLVAVTLARLPQFADVDTLEAKGYHSIQDASTGHEHFVNWDLIGDGRELDPDYPESLVFEMIGGKKTLVSAMFMAEGGVDLEHVPDIGGALTQWHIHNNLCYSESDPPRVVGLTTGSGDCTPPTRTLGEPVPMIHVWIRTHECGPFAALEGVGAGQVKDGETTLCDNAHGQAPPDIAAPMAPIDPAPIETTPTTGPDGHTHEP